MRKKILGMMSFSKISLFIIVIAALLIGGACVYQWWQIKGDSGKKPEGIEPSEGKPAVTITTDKTEYEQGEEVKISIDYDGDLYVWDYPWSSWSVQGKVKDLWIDLQFGFTTFGFSKYEIECKDVSPGKTVECVIPQLEAPAWHLRKGRTITFIWDQRYIISQEIYQCIYKGEIINRKCVNYEQVPPGGYKVRLEYALDIVDAYIRDGVDIKYAEKEFTIKGD